MRPDSGLRRNDELGGWNDGRRDWNDGWGDGIRARRTDSGLRRNDDKGAGIRQRFFSGDLGIDPSLRRKPKSRQHAQIPACAGMTVIGWNDGWAWGVVRVMRADSGSSRNDELVGWNDGWLGPESGRCGQIPACAGMTAVRVGMTIVGVGMTIVGVGMTIVGVGTTVGGVGTTVGGVGTTVGVGRSPCDMPRFRLAPE